MKYFFRDIEEESNCYTEETILDMMEQEMMDEGLTEKSEIIYEAKPTRDIDYFWCRHYQDVAEKGECGKTKCDHYSPRNGKGGICKQYGFCYEPTNKSRTLTLELYCSDGESIKLKTTKK